MSSRSAPSTPPDGRERRIALVKPEGGEEQAGHAVQLFDSVLWVFKGTTRSNWITSSLDAADIVVVHHSEPAAHLERWSQQGKLIIVLSTDARRHPAGPRTLIYPFPAVQVLSMLERVEAELDSGSTAIHTRALVIEAGKAGADPWSFVEALRTLRAVSNASLWLVCKGPNGPFLWLQGDGSRYFCDSAIAAAIRAGSIDLSGLTLQKSAPPPGNLPSRSGAELFWFATYHASESLAPWMSVSSRYRLNRWPDFGRVRAADATLRTVQLRIVAALAVGPATLANLAARAHATIEQTTRTLNALASCALVETAQAAATAKQARPESSAPTPSGGFKNFLRNMRKHLRLGVDT